MHCVFVMLASCTQHLHQFANQALNAQCCKFATSLQKVFSSKGFVSSLTVLRVQSDIWVVLIKKRKMHFDFYAIQVSNRKQKLATNQIFAKNA